MIVYYRIYAEDGALPSNRPVSPGDPFLGRIEVGCVPPPTPHTAKSVKRCIAKVENLKDSESTILYLTPYTQSPLDDAEKVAILKGNGPGSTPQEPLELVSKMSDSERNALESDGRVGLANAAQPNTTPSDIRYLYYLLYADGYEMPSKVANDPEEPSLGRIRADCVAPPRSLTSIKRCISRVEGNPRLVNSDLFADISCDTPLKEGHISILRTDGPGLSPNEPMAIVQWKSILDGRYVIKNRAKDIFWCAEHNPIRTVYFYSSTMEYVKKHNILQWDITQDAYGNITLTSPFAPSSWVGAELKGSTVPVPWQLIPADGESFYLTTDVFRDSQNPRVPAAPGSILKSLFGSGEFKLMSTLEKGDQRQMWEFIRI